MKLTHEDAEKVIAACVVLEAAHIGDFIYSIRERCMMDVPAGVSTWEAPRVKAFGAACVTVAEIAKKYGPQE